MKEYAFSTRKLCYVALFTALNIIMSSFGVPVPGGHLYLNDIVICFAALLFDPLSAFIVGGVGAFFGAAIVGKWVGFYPVEAGITAGLCMANMGGTGDVAVLSAADRMELMPFAQISSRLGGAIILIIGSLLLSTLGSLL